MSAREQLLEAVVAAAREAERRGEGYLPLAEALDALDEYDCVCDETSTRNCPVHAPLNSVSPPGYLADRRRA